MNEGLSLFLNFTVVGQQLWQIIVFFVFMLASMILGRLSRFLLERTSKRHAENSKEVAALFLKTLAKPAMILIITVGLRISLSTLTLTGKIGTAVLTVAQVLYTLAIAYGIYRLVDIADFYLERLSKRTGSKLDNMLVPLVGKSLRVTIVLLAVLQVAQSVSDRPIHSIIAGLGVGGLAVALAGQETLKNFFGSLIILADKPFEIGDRIVVDGHEGHVENVGFRSTRIRRLDGRLITVPNAEMVAKTVENIGKSLYFRRLANITITYDTPPEKVARAVQILKEILNNHEGMKPEFPPRVFFSDFNDWSLNLMMVYWYHPADHWRYQAFAEKVNMEILRRFSQEGIDFAFPSQTLYLAGDGKRRLAVEMAKEPV